MTALLANIPTKAESLLISLVQAAGGIGVHVNVDKTEYMCFYKKCDVSTLNDSSLKLVDKFPYLGSCFLSTDNDINMQLAKAWTAVDRLSIIWKSDISDKIECNFFQDPVVSVLLYGCTTWRLLSL